MTEAGEKISTTPKRRPDKLQKISPKIDASSGAGRA